MTDRPSRPLTGWHAPDVESVREPFDRLRKAFASKGLTCIGFTLYGMDRRGNLASSTVLPDTIALDYKMAKHFLEVVFEDFKEIMETREKQGKVRDSGGAGLQPAATDSGLDVRRADEDGGAE